MSRLLPLAAAALSVGLVACGERTEPPAAAGDGRLLVVATISPVTNLVANVAGGLAIVRGVVPEGVNAHTFEPAPSTVKLLAEADVIFLNGLSLDEPMKQLAEANHKAGAHLIELGEATIAEPDYLYDASSPEARDNPNPHLWTNPRYAKRYAELAMLTLAAQDPPNAQAYRRNYERLAAQLDALDQALATASASLPKEARKLLTYHDSFPYFARDHGWLIVGAIQPADFSEPTPRELARLIDQVKQERVRAIFGSEVFPSPVLEQLARETGADYVDDLRDDDLPGEPGDAEHSLLALLQFDYATIVDALGGDATALRELDTTNPTSDDAEYAR